MNKFSVVGRAAAGTAAVVMTISARLTMAESPVTQAAAATPVTVSTHGDVGATVTAAFQVTDVALDSRGGLSGQAVTQQGQPLANRPVVLDDGARQVTSTTDAAGQFRFEGLRGGAYRVQVADQSQFCRAWRQGTAPPAANRGLMVVEGGPTVLGQYCSSPVGCGSPVGAGFAGAREALKNPLVVGGIIAAAIAIPVALHNADDDDPAPAS